MSLQAGGQTPARNTTDAPMTPLNEMLAFEKAGMEEFKDAPGQQGAFWRLVAQIDAHKVSGWVHGEEVRGTSAEDIGGALANVVANMAAPVFINACCTACALNNIRALFLAASETSVEILKKGQAVLIDNGKGTQHEVTLRGMMQARKPR